MTQQKNRTYPVYDNHISEAEFQAPDVGQAFA